MAGQLKRENPNIEEDLVLIRALRDSNLPKFLADDAILFKVCNDGGSLTQSQPLRLSCYGKIESL